MKEKIIDHLTMKHLSADEFSPFCNQRIRTAHILAKKNYEKLTEGQKQDILREIEEGKSNE
jgi:hypothetical protein